MRTTLVRQDSELVFEGEDFENDIELARLFGLPEQTQGESEPDVKWDSTGRTAQGEITAEVATDMADALDRALLADPKQFQAIRHIIQRAQEAGLFTLKSLQSEKWGNEFHDNFLHPSHPASIALGLLPTLDGIDDPQRRERIRQFARFCRGGSFTWHWAPGRNFRL